MNITKINIVFAKFSKFVSLSEHCRIRSLYIGDFVWIYIILSCWRLGMRNSLSSVFHSKPQSLTPIYNMPEEYSNTIMSLYWDEKIRPYLKVLKNSMLCNYKLFTFDNTNYVLQSLARSNSRLSIYFMLFWCSKVKFNK